jgi:hypothetical protein
MILFEVDKMANFGRRAATMEEVRRKVTILRESNDLEVANLTRGIWSHKKRCENFTGYSTYYHNRSERDRVVVRGRGDFDNSSVDGQYGVVCNCGERFPVTEHVWRMQFFGERFSDFITDINHVSLAHIRENAEREEREREEQEVKEAEERALTLKEEEKEKSRKKEEELRNRNSVDDLEV